MKNSITKYFPGFCPLHPEEFDGVDGLLKTKVLEPFKGYALAISHHYSDSRPELNQDLLMAVKDNGEYWWVVGNIKNSKLLDLPEWVAHKIPNRLIIV